MLTILNNNGDIFHYTRDSWFVVLTDIYLTYCRNRTCKRIIICKTYQESKRLSDALRNNPKNLFTDIITSKNVPSFDLEKCYLSVHSYHFYNTGMWMQYTNIPE